MSAASAHSNYISHTPAEEDDDGTSSPRAPSLLWRVGSAAQSALQALSFGAASSLLPTLNSGAGGGRRSLGLSLQDGGYSAVRSQFTGRVSSGRRGKRSGAAALLARSIDNDPLVIEEDEAFHRRVVQVLLLVGVFMLLFVGSTAIFTLEGPGEGAQPFVVLDDGVSEVPPLVGAVPVLADAPQLTLAHEAEKLQLQQEHEHGQEQEHLQPEQPHQPDDSAHPVASEPASYAEHEQHQEQHTEGDAAALPAAAALRPLGALVSDPSEATSAEDEALAALAQAHVRAEEEAVEALARSQTMQGHEAVRAEQDRAREEEEEKAQLQQRRQQEEEERLQEEREAEEATAQLRGRRRSTRASPPPRRYGPLCTHVLSRHADLFGSLDARAPPLALLAQRSAVALVGPPRRIRDRRHARGKPRQLVQFQPRDLHTPLSARSVTKQIESLRTALAAEGTQQQQQQDGSGAPAAASPAPADTTLDADTEAAVSASLIGVGFVDAQVLEALPPAEWRRFALPEPPPYDDDSGEPLAWLQGSDHGEVWIVGAEAGQQQHQ